MILDTSAIAAVVFREPGYEKILDAMASNTPLSIGVPTLVETAIVLSARMGRDARGLLARLLQEGGVEQVPFGEEHYGIAVEAWLRFGKGRHPASLTFGDCMTYAVAKAANRPLLCTGDDFPQTDLRPASPNL